ncbi:YeeE/YedE family protein [Nocardiopsis sp. MG754419]|uniref:YeeE/YedE family protein n=1 Tax=Nocardiopsis sp. MG754419 TaxID=2259865 RepID=UPI0027DCE071|nr:YeeE/YedE family protein [Nocardiopsis sp. MG754419]MBR8743219.1 YeeE/YedE family protein [Nocardiopsis sp. MG754419]
MTTTPTTPVGTTDTVDRPVETSPALALKWRPTLSVPPPQAPDAAPVRWWPLAVALIGGLGLTAFVWSEHGALPATLLALGLGLGFTLFHSRFGFTSAWRQFLAVGNGTGLRAHAVLLGTTATLFALIIGTGTGLFGNEPGPSAGPIGIALFAGAFLFGIGMQLGGACASGTLFAVGSGQSAIVITLFGFIVGSVIYSAAWPLVADLPAVPPVLLSDHVGWGGSWAITIAALIAMVVISRVVQNRRVPPPVGAPPAAQGWARVLRGSWPLVAGALVLAVLGAAVLVVSGGSWGITSAFNLWGAKALQLLGFQPETWAFWSQPDQAAQLAGPILQDKNSLTNIGIILGAAVAAAAAGTWKLHTGLSWNLVAAGLVGGILMGIGARLAGGCNIGAYLAGIASGSLHGWLWAVFALAGTWAGLRARSLFGLGVPKPSDSVC